MAEVIIEQEHIEEEPGRGKKWSREYPPLITMVIALLVAFLVLPSSLNLPQSNPTTVLEFAPVPPDDDTPPPPQEGSLSVTGFGNTDSLTTDTGVDIPNPTNPGKGDRASTYRCVGQPLRQTEDPNSPPCQPFFDGDNGGATWQGVTAEEVKVLIYGTGGVISDQSETEAGDTSAGEQTPSGVYCDIAAPSADQTGCLDETTGNELSSVSAIKALASYFNNRFQTYKRFVHFYVYWTGCGGTCPPAQRRADAASNWEELKPFAAVDVATFGGNNDAYADAIARRNTMIYGSFGSLPNKFYRTLAPMLWSFWPDVEHDVELYTTWVCTRIAPYPVTKSGNPGENGQKRKYALQSTSDKSKAGFQLFYRLAKPILEQCGVTDYVEIFVPEEGYTNDAGGDNTFAINNVAKMQDEDVTTVLWMNGMEPKTSRAMAAANYFPEIFVAGSRHNDDLINGRAQNQQAWRQAVLQSSILREDRFADTPARQAFREASPNGRQIHEYYATLYYRDIFTMMKGIQVAGPVLAPQAVDQGNHQIPRYSSDNPYVAACFYDPEDYSCVKDSQEAWWDSTAPDPNGEAAQGCWRMMNKGKRWLAGEFPKGNFTFNPSDPCNGVKGTGSNRTV